jgi:molybdopterin converting factor small subunit
LVQEDQLSVKRLRVKLFGNLREIVGKKEIRIKFNPPDMSLSEVISIILEYYPNLSRTTVPYIVSINQRIATKSAKINANDEVAFLPPVSGG